MTVESFARSWRLKTRLDECGDKIIPGKRGHLYFDRDALCLMVLDGAVSVPRRWKALGGKLWLGDVFIEPDTGKRAQDVKITGIPLENAQAAIRMARVKPRRVLSPAQSAVLDKMRTALPQKQRQRLESIGEGRSDS